ncbi:MAG TPA: lipopolysaccharide biosynthesis protein [Porphyromonadaceae bacterium]|nr:lipopolysaccharide biosynthesis protein [Porphyromonadaceae bacterium]
MTRVIKQNKAVYYIRGFLSPFFRSDAETLIRRLEKKMTAEDKKEIDSRLNYYNKLTGKEPFEFSGNRINDLRHPVSPKAYYFDTYQYAKHFHHDLFINYEFGDVTYIPAMPSIVKSRPVEGDNRNSVLLKLDKARHFAFVEGDKPLHEKKDRLIGRGAISQEHRIRFFERYYSHPMCDLGKINDNGQHKEWLKPKIPIKDHLDYKFILSLQGYDVATNLKWVMSSNSLAVLPKPTVETWFMEGTLKGGEHYVEIADDYSDLEEVLEYYISHPKEAKEITENAHRFVAQFRHKEKEDLLSLFVLRKYFASQR